MKEKFEKPKVKKIYTQRYVDKLEAKCNRVARQVEKLEKSKEDLMDENKNLVDSIVLCLDVQTKNYKKLEQAKEIIQKAVFQNICYNCDFGITHCNQCRNGILRKRAEEFLKEE